MEEDFLLRLSFVAHTEDIRNLAILAILYIYSFCVFDKFDCNKDLKSSKLNFIILNIYCNF